MSGLRASRRDRSALVFPPPEPSRPALRAHAMNRHRLIVMIVILGLAVAKAEARPAHKKALADRLGALMTRKLNDCRTCHVPAGPDDDPEDKPHNPFGARMKAVHTELERAGSKTGISKRLDAIADEDSDGDGVANLLELLAGRYPGEADDTPSAAELAAARKALVAFRKGDGGDEWSPFDRFKRPDVPKVGDSLVDDNPIDAFLEVERRQRGLAIRPEADRTTLLRRVSLDVTGLPPTPAELHDFLADTSSNAYEKVVDRLLESPRHGERWGRHWMDVWRYSDWAGWGQQVRDSQPHIWHWRDWIVESLNQDKPYDRMIVEMLAADEASPPKTPTPSAPPASSSGTSSSSAARNGCRTWSITPAGLPRRDSRLRPVPRSHV